MNLRVYNTLTQQKEPFRTVRPKKVGMYVCGPTVYSKSHLGHMVGPVIFDVIKRYLTYRGFEVNWVVNITDVDDKLIVQAQKDGTSVKDLAESITDDYLTCLKALGVDGIDHMPRATDHIVEIVSMTQGLIDKGFAYASAGDVYFDATKSADYGKLSHRDPEALLAGARIETGTKKRNPGDFALWKGSKPGEPAWESPWGPGRPGWHIECSAMSMKLLGEELDIHGGGLDLVFPHHENEVAQSEAFTGKPFAHFWLHNGLLTHKGRKVSKSDPDTVIVMADLLETRDADTLRALFLLSHYRRPIDYGPGRLDEIDRALQAFHGLFDRFERLTRQSFYSLDAPKHRDEPHSPSTIDGIDASRERFLDMMDDDFNTGGALGELFEMVRLLNRFADVSKLDANANADLAKIDAFRNGLIVLKELTNILGLFRAAPEAKKPGSDDALTDSLLDLLVQLRAEVRKAKNFALSDMIRDRLASLGVTLEDRPDGTGWKKKLP